METEAVLWRRLDAPGHDACRLLRHGGGWRLEGAAVFLREDGPAALAVGEAAEVWAAWLDAPGGGVERLRQRYERRAADRYQYEAPRFGYAGLLQVRPSGFVAKYPGLWEAEP